MASPEAFAHVYIWSGVWQGVGYSSIIYIAALSSVSPELHEAAIVDGANILQRVWHIDVPSIMPTMVTLLIMRAGSIMNLNFDRAYLLQNDLNISISEIISTYEYKVGLRQGQFSYSAAIGLFNNIVNITVLLIANYISRKVSETSLV
jgi:putative aldouronate transport system permease protein